MRYFTLCVVLFTALLAAQSVRAQERATDLHDFSEYQFYQEGYTVVSSSSAAVQGRVFKPVTSSTLYEVFPGVELSLVGSDDFAAGATTDENGSFAFPAVPVGTYTVVAHYGDEATGALGSVTVSISGSAKSGPRVTQFSADALLMVFNVDTNDLSILGRKTSDRRPEAAEPNPAANTAVASVSGAMGHSGLLAAGLGAAGLAAGIAALVDDDNHGFRPLPMTVGAPKNK